ncbi:hypothetical protein [Leptothrix ochracea]|jgi:hypothetical protein|uniref:hypothetical protein n=1 Tax=Leptothrix ochracea TaxID=735331 RepID=UPI0034E23F10
MDMLMRVLLSAPNWFGLSLAIAVLLLQIMGLLNTSLGLGLAGLGYGAGFVIGGLWLGFPSSNTPQDWHPLAFDDDGSTREVMERALAGVRSLTQFNPDNRIPASLQARVLALCKNLDALLAQWERSQGTLSMEHSFHARHIAISYLPEMLNTYLAIPAKFATTRVLDNGKTAAQIFEASLAELETEVSQLGDDLAAQDAHAFLVHSTFLKQKFAPQGLDAPALHLPPNTLKASKEPTP